LGFLLKGGDVLKLTFLHSGSKILSLILGEPTAGRVSEGR